LDTIFAPIINNKNKSENQFIVGFWGSFIPLQGIQYIIKAAKLLKDDSQIKFILIGKGQTYLHSYRLTKQLKLNNLEFKGFIPLKDLPHHIAEVDIGLGIFGNTPKAIQVIPNKVFEGSAMKLPMISCKSPAINELFTHNKNIYLCERANPESLAKAIRTLKYDEDLRRKIGENAYQLFQKYCSIEAIGKKLEHIFRNILNTK
jgi:glycosyltransferase involved in cell wall biosynthesis